MKRNKNRRKFTEGKGVGEVRGERADAHTYAKGGYV